ncbi:DUF6415 family natural product biosynthesis protein [Streptomyces shenzhenensis]|uniref:DUF6415 family natural product biosynthesis protein n=1 Tax=Streptomyces shenzhenensis TaxID=943815 RepID=UPI003809344D
MSAPTDRSTAVADLAAMRQATVLVLGPEGRPHALPPSPVNLSDVIATLRGYLEWLVPQVERQAARMPKDSVARACACACVGQARRRLSTAPSHRYGGDIGHARRLARVLCALCDDYESTGETP